MKRTKETYFRYHPDWANREGMSGCREFDGEDLTYPKNTKQEFDARIKYNKEQQKKWLEDQMRENEMKRQREKEEERMYALQTQEMNRMRGMLEDEFQNKKSDMRWDLRENNQVLAKQKKDKEDFLKQKRLHYEQNDLNNMIERGQKQAYP